MIIRDKVRWWWAAGAVVLYVVGFGGVPDDLKTWTRWIESFLAFVNMDVPKVFAIILGTLVFALAIQPARYALRHHWMRFVYWIEIEIAVVKTSGTHKLLTPVVRWLS